MAYDEANIAEIMSMSSYRGHEMFIKPGSFISKTRNIFTWVGLLRIVNEDHEALQRDWDRLDSKLHVDRLLSNKFPL